MNKRIALAAVCSALSLCTLTTGFTLKNTTVRPPETDHGVIVSQPTKMAALDPAATVVMCSAMGQEAMVMDSIKSGAKDFIVKPFKPERILSTIKKILG